LRQSSAARVAATLAELPEKCRCYANELISAIPYATMDSLSIGVAVEKMERSELISMHPYKKHTNPKGEWCVNFPDETKKEGRVIRRRKTEKELDDLIVEFWKSKMENPTLDEVFAEWNDWRLAQNKIAPATHSRNRQCYNRFFSEFGKKRIKTVQPFEIEDFLEKQITKFSLTAKAFSGLKGITKGFLLRAKKRGLINWNVNETFGELDVSDKQFTKAVIDDEKEVYYDDEMEAILKYCKEHPDTKNLGVALMFATGLRVGELVALKHDDFDGMIIDVKRSETAYYDLNGDRVVEVQDKTKTAAGTREVIIPEKYKWIVNKLRLCNPFGEFIFTNDEGVRMNTNIIRKRVMKLCKKMGFLNKSPHKIRKTYGSILLDNNVDRKMIEKQMGHTDVLTTEIHYHRDRKRISDKMAILNNIPEFAV